jgi:hypothetical protein
MKTIKQTELTDIKRRLEFWESTAKRETQAKEYYQTELEKAHTLLGRVIHQLSENWDDVNLTKYFPTDNLYHKRDLNNPSGNKEKE